MSEGAAEASGGGEALSGAQFGDVTGSNDLPPGETAQNPGDGLWMYGFYPWNMAQNVRQRARRRKPRRDR